MKSNKGLFAVIIIALALTIVATVGIAANNTKTSVDVSLDVAQSDDSSKLSESSLTTPTSEDIESILRRQEEQERIRAERREAARTIDWGARDPELKSLSPEHLELLCDVYARSGIEGLTWCVRDMKMIKGELPDDTPRLTEDLAREILTRYAETVEEEPDTCGTPEEKLNEVAGAPDYDGGSGLRSCYYVLEDGRQLYVSNHSFVYIQDYQSGDRTVLFDRFNVADKDYNQLIDDVLSEVFGTEK